MAKKKQNSSGGSTIALNKKARFNYHLSDKFEAGLQLQGWEVKALREGRANLQEGYVTIKDAEAYLVGAHFSPPSYISDHQRPNPTRQRKLLLHRYQIDQMIGAIEQKGFTLVPTALYWKHGRAKCEVALAKGKQAHDKRQTIKQRDWDRTQHRLLKQ